MYDIFGYFTILHTPLIFTERVVVQMLKNNDRANQSAKNDNTEGSTALNQNEIRGFYRAVPVILCAAALFLTLCFITGETGAFGSFISSVLKGLFSYMAYTIPAFIVLHAIFFFSDLRQKRIASRIIMSLIALITLSEIAYIIPYFSQEMTFNAGTFYTDGINGVGGGFIGSSIAYGIIKLIGKVGLIILIAVTFCLYLTFCFAGKGGQIYAYCIKKLAACATFFAKIEAKREEKKKRSIEASEEKRRIAEDKKNADFMKDSFFHANNGISHLEIPELGIMETKSGAKAEAAFNLRNSVPKESGRKEETKRPVSDYGVCSNEIKFERASSASEYKSDDIIYDAADQTQKDTAKAFEIKSQPASASSDFSFDTTSFKIDESAESVFTADFDPYNLAINEREASKKSTRAAEYENRTSGFTEDISELTPEKVEKMRRNAEFEARKQEALRRRAALELGDRPKEAANANDKGTNDTDCKENAVNASNEPSVASECISHSTSAQFSFADYSASQSKAPSLEETEYPESREGNFENDISSYSRASGASGTPDFARNGILDITSSYTEPNSDMPKQEKNAAFAYGFDKETANITEASFTPQADAVNCSDSSNRSCYYSCEPNQQSTAQKAEPTMPEHYGSVLESSSENATFATSDAAQARTEETAGTDALATNHLSENQKAASEPFYEISEQPPKALGDSSDMRDFSLESESYFDSPAQQSLEFAVSSDEYDASSDEFNSEGELSYLTVNREMIESELDSDAQLDFSADYDNEELAFGEPEESIERTEIPLQEQNAKLYEYQKMYDIFKNNESIAEQSTKETEYTESSELSDKSEPLYDENADTHIEKDGIFDNESETDGPPFDFEEKEEPPKKAPPRPDYSSYKFPPIDLLSKGIDEDLERINEEIHLGGEKLITTLESFNIRATVRGIERGPTVTRYSIVPAKGVRVNQIEKLSDDIALALAAESIRIEAPIPGKSAVGVEVPNATPSVVSLRDLIESEEFTGDKSSTIVCIGKSVEGTNIFGDISKMPHLLIAGATGMGKSVCINSLITSILYKARPDEVKFIMIDPKKVEFAPYNGIPHLLVPVVTDPKQAAGALVWAVDEMNKRYDIIEKLYVRSIDSYNEKVKENPELGAPMTKIVIFIDELNDLMIQVRDPVENLIMLIAQKARAAGIHLVIGTQRPSVNVITGVIKANIPSRIACKVSSGVDSRTILEQIGAEKLIGRGDMLFAPGGRPNPKRVQGAYVSENETASIVDFVKKQAKGTLYDEQAMEDMRKAAQKCDKSKNGFDDDVTDNDVSEVGYLHDRKFLDAVELAINSGSVATSFLQRKLRIGYGKAAQYIDTMEDLGIVGEKNGAKARDVLISMQEWREKLARLTDD